MMVQILWLTVVVIIGFGAIRSTLLKIFAVLVEIRRAVQGEK